VELSTRLETQQVKAPCRGKKQTTGLAGSYDFSIYIDKQRSVWTLFPQILLLGLAYGIISRKMLSNALKLHKKYKFAFESKLIFP